jgi:hypothetical protein
LAAGSYASLRYDQSASNTRPQPFPSGFSLPVTHVRGVSGLQGELSLSLFLVTGRRCIPSQVYISWLWRRARCMRASASKVAMSGQPEDVLENSTLVLKDGRKLGYAQYGSPTGRPVFFLHGHPASRLEAAHLHDDAVKVGARIICPERPGFGLSSPQPGRTLLDTARDVEQLGDHLKLEKYGILVGTCRSRVAGRLQENQC